MRENQRNDYIRTFGTASFVLDMGRRLIEKLKQATKKGFEVEAEGCQKKEVQRL